MIPKVLVAIICASCMLFACTRAPSLQEKLLSLGGQSVEQQDEPDADRILSRGPRKAARVLDSCWGTITTATRTQRPSGLKIQTGGNL